MNTQKELKPVKAKNGQVKRYVAEDRVHTNMNMYFWLSIYGIFVSSIFLVKTLTMYINHEPAPILSPLAHAQTLPYKTEKPKSSIKTSARVVVKPEFDKKAFILSQKHGDILIRIWGNESSRGSSDGLAAYCSDRGQSNEFGYDPQEQYCFSSFQYSVERINSWFETCLANSSLGACLETYSGNSDTYIDKFLAQSNN